MIDEFIKLLDSGFAREFVKFAGTVLLSALSGGFLARMLTLKAERRKMAAEAGATDAEAAASVATASLEQQKFLLGRIQDLEKKMESMRQRLETEREEMLTVKGQMTVMRLQMETDSGQRLKRCEAALEELFKASRIGMAYVALDGSWMSVNDSVCRIMGYSRSELLTMTFQQLTHPDDLVEDLDYVDRMIAGKITTYTMRKRYYQKSGDVLCAELTVTLVRLADGRPQHFISQIIPLTAEGDVRTIRGDKERD